MAAAVNRAKWTAIVLTCRNEETANAYQRELEIKRDKGEIDREVVLLTVEDPKGEVGSGGATLNALLVVAEHISAKQGYTVINADVFSSSLILVIHVGRSFPFDSVGRAFTSLPLYRSDTSEGLDGLTSNLDLLLEMMTTRLAAVSPPGVWVCSSDMFLEVVSTVDASSFSGSDACIVTVPGEIQYAMEHGVCKVDSMGFVEDILYQCKSTEVLGSFCNAGGLLPLVCGVVFLNATVADRILSFHVLPPLDCCTYLGLDSGALPIRLSLFFDIMLSLCVGMTKEKFVERKSVTGDSCDADIMRAARRLIFKLLGQFRAKALCVTGKHSYMDLLPRQHLQHLLQPVSNTFSWKFARLCHSCTETSSCVADDALLINSIVRGGASVGSRSVISHCRLNSVIHVGSNCLVTGLESCDFSCMDCSIRSDSVVIAYSVRLPTFTRRRIVVVFGVSDKLQTIDTFCNEEFSSFLQRTGIRKSDLWDETVSESSRSLWNARLYPFMNLSNDVDFSDLLWLSGGEATTRHRHGANSLQRWRSSWRLSLEEILSRTDIAAEFQHRRNLFFDIGKWVMCDTLLNCRDRGGLNVLYSSAAIEGYSQLLFTALDNIGEECSSAGIAARTLANIADVLGAMARGAGGLRSGPACNKQFELAFRLLEAGDISRGFAAMAAERRNWLQRPGHLVRAARHYEGAAQILIRHAVLTARQFIHTTPCVMSPMHKWVMVECPARVDVAGGWSDTPPITYEHGGAVCNVAITVDGKKPVGARVRRIESLEIILHIQDAGQVTISQLGELSDYNQPHVPGALLKAALVCAKIVEFPSSVPLDTQLREKYAGGFEIESWSNLPHGSGLGTSSILAGAVMAVLWRASGKLFDIDSLNHAVLHLEQMLTTGGGWQDQVGGLIPGIKIGHSEARLPLQIDVKFLNVTEQTVKAFGDQLVLVYTGKTRLARNLLQNVIRNWYARNPEIVSTENRLFENAWACAAEFEKGDLAAVGRHMSEYWQLKKLMAPGSEPELVTRIMRATESRVPLLGMSLAGAGGGGFMYLLTRDPGSAGAIRQVLATVQGAECSQVYSAAVDESGLVLTIEDEGLQQIPFRMSDRH